MSESRFFEQPDGSKIAYKILKSENIKNDIPLVLIIGFGGTKEHFMGFDEELAKTQEVIIFDNRGIGESTVASYDDPITMELMAKDAIELIKHLGIKKFNLFGGSMGAMIALCVALNVPSDLKLEKFIISSGSAQVSTSSKKYQELEELCKSTEFTLPKTIQGQKDMLLYSSKDLARYFLEHPDEIDKLYKFAEIIVKTNNKRPFEIFKRQWEAIKQYNIVSKLHTIKVPTLIIHGEDDEVIPIQDGEIIDREIPNTQFYRIPNVGHCIYELAPESINIINEFLNN